MQLNKEQKKAVLHKDGPMMVLAGPGSGKTTLLTWHIRCLMEYYQIPGKAILVVTYTKAAAQEMRSRFLRFSGTDSTETAVFGTIHSICYQQLRLWGFHRTERILDENESAQLLQKILCREDSYSSVEAEELSAQILGMYSKERNTGKREEAAAFSHYDAVIRSYEVEKRKLQALDYDDLLTEMDRLLQEDTYRSRIQAHFRYLLVDEFQDVSPLQYRILRKIVSSDGNFFVVGDDDQAIYGFRGAQSSIMQRFCEDYPRTERITLHANYRSTARIIRLSESVIQKNRVRFAKETYAAGNHARGKIRIRAYRTLKAEARALCSRIEHSLEHGEKTVLLFRTVFQSQRYLETLRDYGFLIHLKDRWISAWEHWTGDDLCLIADSVAGKWEAIRQLFSKLFPHLPDAVFSWAGPDGKLQELLNSIEDDVLYLAVYELSYTLKMLSKCPPSDGFAWFLDHSSYLDYVEKRIAKSGTPYRKIRERLHFWQKDLKAYADWSGWKEHREKEIGLWRERERKEAEDGSILLITTIHAAKGLEYDTVFLPGIEKERVPYYKNADTEEERRLFYVALTRAKNKLFISSSSKEKGKTSLFWPGKTNVEEKYSTLTKMTIN